MKRIAGIVLLVAVALIAIAYTDPTPTGTKSKKSTAGMTPAQRRRAMMAPTDTQFLWPYRADEGRVGIRVTGEILDLFCYLDRGFSGEVHRQCAYNCIHGGEPMGILTRDGKVYMLCIDHWYAMDHKNQTYWKSYDQAKEWAGMQVTIGGFLVKRKGLQAIEVRESNLVNEFESAPPDTIKKGLYH